MSLLNAKRIAELNDEIETASKQVSAKFEGFRKAIDDDVMSSFCGALSAHDFVVTKSADGAKALYKGLKVELRLAGPEDRFMGVFHSFDVLVDGKENFVTVIPELSGQDKKVPPMNAEKIERLEGMLEVTKNDLQNVKLVSYKYDCTGKGEGRRAQPLARETVAEILDEIMK